MKVFAYVRVSTEEQAEKGNSLNEQQERLTAYCKVMDWEDPVWYIDDGYSAKDTRRPKMTMMLDDVKHTPGAGVVITTKLDRLSRNLFDILSLSNYFDKHNFSYVSATESFDTSTAAGRLTLQVLGMVAEFERERNSERVRDNMLSMARKIMSDKTITRPCFGYDVINGVMTINLEEAIVLRKMADMADTGAGARAIAKWLNNEEKSLTKDGNEWHEKIVRELLQRETLIGNFVYNKTYKKGSRVIKRPEEEWIIVENHHDPILDHEQFKRIKKMFEGRKSIGRHISEDRYLLSGLVKCGHCGASMNGKVDRNYSKRLGRENIHYRYICDGYLKRANCFHHVVNRDALEGLIIKRIHEAADCAPGKLQLVVASPKKDTLERESIMTKLNKLDQKLQKQLEAYEDELISKGDLRKAKERVENDRQRLTEALKAIDEGIDHYEQRKVQEGIQKRLADISSMDRLKAKHAIREVIHKIEIKNGDNIQIEWSSPL